MSLAALSIAASVAGSPLAQIKGAEIDRIRREADAQRVELEQRLRAATAAGVAASDGQEKRAGDRDANGRRSWELSPFGARGGDDAFAAEHRLAHEFGSTSGAELDLCG